MNFDEKNEQVRLKEAIEYLENLGWKHMASWAFSKSGKIYDLSAADLRCLDTIEEKGLFVIEM